MQAMKTFAQWEAREERRLHKDLQEHQRGVLFLGELPSDHVLPNPNAGVLRVPEASVLPSPSRNSRPRPPRRTLSRRTPFTDVKGKRPMIEPLPPEISDEIGPSGMSLAGHLRLASGAGEAGPSEDVLAGINVSHPPGLPLPGRLQSAPAELPALSGRLQPISTLQPAENPEAAEDELPEVSVAILADGLVVRCATLGPTAPAPSRRRTAFCPATLDVFAWPMDQYDLASRCVGSSVYSRVKGSVVCWRRFQTDDHPDGRLT